MRGSSRVSEWIRSARRIQQILSEQKRPLRFIVSRLLWRLGISHWFIIQREGYRLRFFPTSLSAEYWINPFTRCDDELFLKQNLGAGDYVIDVGANVGTIALAAATLVGRQGTVIAIEPHPRTSGYLQANVRLNDLPNITVLNMAVGKESGAIMFSDIRNDDQNCVVNMSPLVVPMATLDSLLLGEERRVKLLKIDVEGYELPVLQGGERTLRRTDCVYFESWEKHYNKYGYTCGDLIRQLNGWGFSVYKRVEAGELREVGPQYSSVVCENLVALSRGRGGSA